MDPELPKKIEAERTRNANLRNTVEQLENALVQYRKDAKNKEEGTGKIMLADLKRLLKTAELDTQKLIQRHNEAVAENNKLKGTVNTARNERIVHSGIFKNLEKEIRLYQSTYKFLLVQRRIQQRNARKTVQYFDKIRRCAQTKLQSMKTLNPSQCQSTQMIHFETKTTAQQPKKRTILVRKNHHAKTQFNLNFIQIQREKLRNYQRILETLKATTGLESIQDIDTNEEDLEYDIEQLYQTSCAINEDIEELEAKIEQERKKAQREGESEADEQDQALNAVENGLEQQITTYNQDIQQIYSKLFEVGRTLGITDARQSTICQQLEQKLEQNPPEPQYGSLSDILSVTPKLEQQENRLNSLLQKSKQVKQVDQILSVTQFKQAFKEIQNKQSEHSKKK